MPKRRSLRLLVLLFPLIAVLGGCQTALEDGTNTTVPCADAAIASLGHVSTSAPPAFFTTDGSSFYVSASGFPHGGIFDPKVGATAIYMGDAARLPTYDPRSSSVSDAVKQFHLQEGEKREVVLAPGRYWLWSSNTLFVTAEACSETAITAVEPASLPNPLSDHMHEKEQAHQEG